MTDGEARLRLQSAARHSSGILSTAFDFTEHSTLLARALRFWFTIRATPPYLRSAFAMERVEPK
jgi:hypothetical protein